MSASTSYYMSTFLAGESVYFGPGENVAIFCSSVPKSHGPSSEMFTFESRQIIMPHTNTNASVKKPSLDANHS